MVEIWKMIDNNQERVNLLNNYFASVVQKKKESTPLPQFNDGQFMEELNTISITEERSLKAIDRIKSTKSQVPDQIHPMPIMECKKIPIKA